MIRTFAARGRYIHDPASGQTHQHPTGMPPGRHCLDDATVTSLPAAARAPHTPASICWSPIVRCNLSCPQCLDDTTVRENGIAERARIATVLAASGVLGIDISGGEPLLLKDLPNLANRITSANHAVVSMTTNGWHLKRRVDELVGVFDAVRVSLDGASAGAHDAIRGTGSFNRAIAGISACVDRGMRVQIQCVLMNSTRDQTQPMVDLAHRLGAGGVTFLQMLPIGAGVAMADQQLSDAEAERVVDALSIPPGVGVRLRTREAAGGFTVVRADGRIFRNSPDGQTIHRLMPLTRPSDLAITAEAA